MRTSPQDQQSSHPCPQKWMYLRTSGLLSLMLVAALMILSVLNVVPLSSTWFSALGIVFLTLGVILAYCQWALPVSSSLLVGVSVDDHMRQPVPVSDANHDLEILRQQVEGTLNKRLRKGAL